jgi:hypothetical protein
MIRLGANDDDFDRGICLCRQLERENHFLKKRMGPIIAALDEIADRSPFTGEDARDMSEIAINALNELKATEGIDK